MFVQTLHIHELIKNDNINVYPQGIFFLKDVLLSSVYFTYSHTRSYSCSNDNVYWPSAKSYFLKKKSPIRETKHIGFPGVISRMLTDDPVDGACCSALAVTAFFFCSGPLQYAASSLVCRHIPKEGLGPSLLSARFCWSGGSGVSPTGSEARGAQRWGEEAS